MFSDATVIVTRKQPDLLGPGETDRVSVAVVREDDAPDVGLPYYRYLVGADTYPFSVPAQAASDFEPGTLVIHVNYLAGKMGTTGWMYEDSIYANAETLLFRPTLPYSLHDARSGAANRRPEGRQKPSSLSGLAQRLERSRGDGLVTRSNWSTIPVVGVGDVRLRWWLFASPDNRRKRAAKGYSVLFTSNGQVHHTWDHLRFQYLVEGRRRVAVRIIAEVDCDAVDLKMRAKLFDSFRTQVRKGPEGRALEDSVADALGGDADLEEHESEFTRQFLQSSSQQVSEAFRRRLNKAIKLKIPGLRPLGRSGGKVRPPKPRPTVELYDEPTTFTGPEKMTVLVGGRGSTYLEINAIDGFVPSRGQLETVAEPDSPGFQFGVGDLRRGRLRLSMLAPDGAVAGVYAVELALVWERTVGGTARLEWTVKVNVVTELSERKPKGKKPKKASAGDVAFIWSSPSEQETWTAEVAGELQEIKGSDLAERYPKLYSDLRHVTDNVPTIVLNEEFKDYAAYRSSVLPRLGDKQMDERKDRYGLALGVTVANLFAKERNLRKRKEAAEASGTGTTAVATPMTDEQLLRALSEAGRGVLALMPDFDALLGDLGGPTRDEEAG